jgi:kynurenine 3-monooxygenase
MTEVLILGNSILRPFDKFSHVKPWLEALDAVEVGDAVREIAIPMDKRAIHLVDKLNFQNYGQEGEAIYSISRGILNRKMINLAEEAGQNFF